jgi:hypothetical protein
MTFWGATTSFSHAVFSDFFIVITFNILNEYSFDLQIAKGSQIFGTLRTFNLLDCHTLL